MEAAAGIAFASEAGTATHCFLAFSEYIALQLVKESPGPFGRASFFGHGAPRFQVLSAIPGVLAVRRDRA
jgi:hypothetical protein